MASSIVQGNCLDVLPTLDAESFHACVTDAPYHLIQHSRNGSPRVDGTGPFGRHKEGSKGFMGKTWDGGDVAFRPETWDAVARVLKPGAHLLAFGGTRTFHRLVCAIEDAGFEIRDTIMWLYGSGFPKSHDVSKAIDRAAGAEREIVGERPWTNSKMVAGNGISGLRWSGGYAGGYEGERVSAPITAPATDAAREWQGWGTALKPACEPIVVARKPLSEGTVAANVLRHGTGALNIDASRVAVGAGDRAEMEGRSGKSSTAMFGSQSHNGWEPTANGRWPANVAHDGSPEMMEAFPSTDGGGDIHRRSAPKTNGIYGAFAGDDDRWAGYADTGSAARFFFCAKADASERVGNHPTVKPVALMEWLVRLVTPPNGRVLDPFCGTGSTLVACDRLGFDAVAIEQDGQTVADAHEKLRRMRARRMIGDPGQPFLVPAGQLEFGL